MVASRAFSFGLCMGWLILAATAFAANTPTVPAKPTAPAPSGATIYFVRPNGFVNQALFTPDILVDDHKVGELAVGTYFTVHQPAGHHAIKLHSWSQSWQSEIDLAAGQTYFIEVGAYADAPGMQLLTAALAGGAGLKGNPLPGSGVSSYAFYLLDAGDGRAELGKVKNVTP